MWASHIVVFPATSGNAKKSEGKPSTLRATACVFSPSASQAEASSGNEAEEKDSAFDGSMLRSDEGGILIEGAVGELFERHLS